MKATTLTAALLTLVGGAIPTPAKEAALMVGDNAPKLQVGKWIQGEPVKEFERDKAYIVEFWATWCGPCRVSIPHLNETHAKFKDKGLVVIGQDAWERDESLVAPFVKHMGEKMTYRVALDDKEGSEKGKMAETWMEAAGQNGIPSAFVVDKQGKIAWIGHPMSLKESVLEQVLDGKFDLKQAAAQYATQKKNEEQINRLYRQLNGSLQKKQWDEAESAITELEKLMPAEERDGMTFPRFQVLLGRKDYQAAYKLASQWSDSHQDNAMMQNQLAWDIATKDGLEQRDLKLAEKIATRANDAAKGKDPGILDTLARVLFMNGNKEKAIALQQQALDLADAGSKDQFKGTLQSYQEGKLPSAE
jgi:thiol-disulfide isomerase/thioredoxin